MLRHLNEQTSRPDPVTEMIKSERPDVNPDYPQPGLKITRWQAGLLKMFGDLDPAQFQLLWMLCSNVSPNGTSRISKKELMKRYKWAWEFERRRKKMGDQGFHSAGWFTIDERPVILREGVLSHMTRHYMCLNRCILKGQTPENWKKGIACQQTRLRGRLGPNQKPVPIDKYWSKRYTKKKTPTR